MSVFSIVYFISSHLEETPPGKRSSGGVLHNLWEKDIFPKVTTDSLGESYGLT